MKSILSLAFGMAFAAFLAVGCGGPQATAPKPATSDTSKPATSDQSAAAATPDNSSSTPAAADTTAPRTDDSNSVTIKAVEPNGQTVMVTFKTIYFDFDKYTIRADQKDTVQYDAGQLKQAGNVKFVIEGHCDERGTTEYNLALGEHRAVAVMNALAGNGVKKADLSTISYGKEKPADTGHDEAAWAKNRRSIVRQS